jgi:hypothetical protein
MADERRSDPRFEAGVPVVVIPLADVATRWPGRVMDVSRSGCKVHVDVFMDQLPRTGDACRLQTGKDVILCEIRHCRVEGEGSDLGLKIIHWGSAGELDRLIKACQQG